MVAAVIQEHFLPPLESVCPDTILLAGLLDLVSQYPLDVVETRKGYYCFGSLRFYRWVKFSILDPQTKVTVRIYPRMSRDQIASHVFRDLLIVPACRSIPNADIARSGVIWERLKKEPVFTSMFRTPGKKALADLLGVDPRRFKDKRGKKGN